ncbi:MAG: terminase family protein [Candidatus Marinimicrobia bacterium]|nr:terminase family protein [Candidatus Neomarinimicrobiota bacterium]
MKSVLLPYQIAWINDRSPVKAIEKSRRIGLSYCEASDAVLHASDADRGANVYYISYDKEMTSGFIQDCATWAKAFHVAAGEVGEEILTRDDGRDIHVFDIKFASGHHIQTFSSNPRNLRSKGRPGEWLIIDEAAFVDDLAELLKAAMAMTMWGGTIHILSTHNGDDNPFNLLIQDARAEKADCSVHRVTLDDALKAGLYKRICEVSAQEWSPEAEYKWRKSLIKRYHPNEDEELFAIPAFGGGTYLPRELISVCMVDGPLLRFDGTRSFNLAPEPVRAAEMKDWIEDMLEPELRKLDKKRRHVFGMDFARKGDMSDIVPLEIGETLRKRWPFLIELHNVPYKQQEQVVIVLGNGLPRFGGCAIDAGGNGGYIAEAATDAWGTSMVDSVQFTEGFYREEFPKYKAGFEDRTMTIIKHDDVLEDHRAIKLVRGVPRVPEGKTDKKGERHGDSAIAGLLADYRSRRDIAEMPDIITSGVRTIPEQIAGYHGTSNYGCY